MPASSFQLFYGAASMSSFDWKLLPRLIILKTMGVILSVLFLGLAVLFLGYSAIAVSTGIKGRDAKIVSISTQVGKYRTAFRAGGLFDVSVEAEKQKYEHVYSFYPAWPDVLSPSQGDMIKVWPAKKPLVGSPETEGWGWFIVGTFLILGLVMLEFAFLSLTIH